MSHDAPLSLAVRLRLDFPAFVLDVDLKLPGHGVSALFGPSGSGKTTCLRAIAGLERAARGRIAVGEEIWQDDAQGIFLPTHLRPLGYVFQDAALFPHLSVRENLDYGRKRIAAAQRRIQPEAIVELLGIGGLLERRPENLSGGEKSRVAMARALLASPRLLLLDEPLAALDHDRKQEILPYLERLHRELDMPILYVSHSPDEVARLADYLVVIENGAAVAAGALGETLARLDLPIRLGEDTGVVIDARIAERDAAWHLARVEFAGGSLWARDAGHAVGRRVRVRILARDVSVALEKTAQTSIQNILPASVVALGDDTHPAQTLVRLQAGEAPLIARLTRRAAAQLELRPGLALWAQVKAVALIG